MSFLEWCDRCVKHPVSRCCINFVRWIPVIFILAVVGWSYYAYVFELCFYTVENVAERWLYLILYHVILILFLWAYYQTVFCEIGRPPINFFLPRDMIVQLEQAMQPTDFKNILHEFTRSRQLPVQMRAYDGAIRYCDKCKTVKPDRCHHCSICGHCVLKFDHHCPWVNTCVNYRNYKFFIQFLGYALLYCQYIFITDAQYFIWFFKEGLQEGGGKFHIMFMFFVSGMFSVSVAVLFVYHLWLSAMNRTTIESFRDPVFTYGPDKNGFNLGCKRNYQEVFGVHVLYYFLPIFSAQVVDGGLISDLLARGYPWKGIPECEHFLGRVKTLGNGIKYPMPVYASGNGHGGVERHSLLQTYNSDSDEDDVLEVQITR